MTRMLRALRRHRQATIGGALFLLVCAACVFAPLLAPYDPIAQNVASGLRGPSAAHWMGTDVYGRDIFSRVLYGGRPTLAIAGLTVLLALLIGLPIGVAASYYRGWPDLVLMRVAEFGFVLPPLVLAIAVVGALGISARNVVIALGIVFAPMFARVARAATLGQLSSPYVEAAVVGGESDVRVMAQQVLPNIAAPVLVQGLLTFAFAVLAEASLSFLGLGTQPPLPSWGRMLADGAGLIEYAPWLGLFPGLAIIVTVFTLNLFGDGLRDIWDATSGARAGRGNRGPGGS